MPSRRRPRSTARPGIGWVSSAIVTGHSSRSRALPVAAEVARDARVPDRAGARGRTSGQRFLSRGTVAPGRGVWCEPAESVSLDGREALAVVVAEDEEPSRSAADPCSSLRGRRAPPWASAAGRRSRWEASPRRPPTWARGDRCRIRPANVDLAWPTRSPRCRRGSRRRTASLAEERACPPWASSEISPRPSCSSAGTTVQLSESGGRHPPGGSASGAPVGRLKHSDSCRGGRHAARPAKRARDQPSGERFFRGSMSHASRRGARSARDPPPRGPHRLPARRPARRVGRGGRSIAHDIENPLTRIRLAAERLREIRGERARDPASGDFLPRFPGSSDRSES